MGPLTGDAKVENPYKAPNAPLEVVTSEKTDVEIAKKIKNAWVAGLISSGITLVLILIVVLGGPSIGGIDAWSLADCAVFLGLTYGVYRKSRACAVLLLALYAAEKIFGWSTTGSLKGLPVALVIMWFMAQGIVGTFQYHRLQRDDSAS